MSKRRVRRAFKRGKRQARRLDQAEGMDPVLAEALADGVNQKPRILGAEALQMQMVQTVLNRMVQLRLAQWLEAAFLTLRDDLGMSEEQIALFSQGFRERTASVTERSGADE